MRTAELKDPKSPAYKLDQTTLDLVPLVTQAAGSGAFGQRLSREQLHMHVNTRFVSFRVVLLIFMLNLAPRKAIWSLFQSVGLR